MNKREKSMEISAAIGSLINTDSPIFDYKTEEVECMMDSLGESITVMRDAGMYNGDPETLFVANMFCTESGLLDNADDDYLAEFYSGFKRLDKGAFVNNPYIFAVKYSEVKCGNLLLTYGKYEKGELFQYDMPDFSKPIVVPKVGFFSEEVKFPTIYEGNMPWMSVCPSETSTIDPFIEKAFGNVLVLGLGLGYFPFRIAPLAKVKKIIIVEINSGIIDLFKKHVFPFFPNKEKFEFVCADALKYLSEVNDGYFDYCFADIWEGVHDGLPLYEKIKSNEKRLKAIQFDYWIEPQLIAYKQYIEEKESGI